MHLYVNYKNSGEWNHSYYCWCKTRKTGRITDDEYTTLNIRDYGWFDRNVKTFPVDTPKKVFSAEADIETLEEKSMEFDIVASTQHEAMKKAKDFVRKQYPYRTCIKRVSVEELL